MGCLELPKWSKQKISCCKMWLTYRPTVYKNGVSYYLALVHLISSWLVWTEIEFTVHVALPKLPISQFKPVQQSRQQALRAYCPNIYTVTPGIAHDCWIQYQWKTIEKYCWECTYLSHVFTNPEFSICNCLFGGKTSFR